MNALRKKLDGRMNERLKLQEVEHKNLLQRFENVRKQIFFKNVDKLFLTKWLVLRKLWKFFLNKW